MLHEQQQTISMRSSVRELTRSAHEYNISAPAQLLGNRREQRPSNQGHHDSIVTGEAGTVYYTGVCLVLI
jgi:hypothetical protein